MTKTGLTLLHTPMADGVKQLKTGLRPHGYGRGGQEIYVARRGDAMANRAVVANLKNDFTRAVLLADQRDITPALSELQSLTMRMTAVDHLRVNVHCDHRDDFTHNFAAKLFENYSRHYNHNPELRTNPFTALQNEIDATLDDVADYFNLSTSFDLVIHYDREHEAMKYWGDAHGANWHVDGVTVITRPLSPAGTLLGFNTDDAVKTHSGPVTQTLRPASCAETGQGVYILKGNVVHSSPVVEKPRWFYAITSLSLR